MLKHYYIMPSCSSYFKRSLYIFLTPYIGEIDTIFIRLIPENFNHIQLYRFEFPETAVKIKITVEEPQTPNLMPQTG